DGIADVAAPVPVLNKLLSWPTIASKNWVYRQYDHMVRDNTVVCPGSDAAVIRIKADSIPPLGDDGEKAAAADETAVPEKYIALTSDCNGGYVYLDPYEGGKAAVVEAARNLVCAGARPLAITDNLNFGNPYNPELFWQLRESVRGIADACRALNTPVTGGNCSLYNQSPAGPIDPTPTIGMVGLIERREHITTQWFKDEGDAVIVIGNAVDRSDPLEGLGGSAYLKLEHGLKTGNPPRCNLEKARLLNTSMLSLICSGDIKSAHDCSEGGLAVCLAECCISHLEARNTPRLIGAEIDLSEAESSIEKESGALPRLDALLFGETQHRIVITTSDLDAAKVVARAKLLGLVACRIGRVGGDTLVLKTRRGEWRWLVAELHDLWWNSIARML
ncbi:MAG: AIR synthase related protein, partial [Verrucomicrobiia bacterium]